jgi:hypothetical protein
MTKEQMNDLVILIKNLKYSKCPKTSLEKQLMDNCEDLVEYCEKLSDRVVQLESEVLRLRRSI